MGEQFSVPRGSVVFAIGAGKQMDAEWEAGHVAQAQRRLVDAAVPYMTGNVINRVFWGTNVVIAKPAKCSELVDSTLHERPECGPGANLSGALYAALSQRQGDEPLLVFVVSDMNIDPEELERAKHVVRHAPNTVVIIVRVSTDIDGSEAAYEFDEFATNESTFDCVELVHFTDHCGRLVGSAGLEGHIRRRLDVIGARRATAAQQALAKVDADV